VHIVDVAGAVEQRGDSCSQINVYHDAFKLMTAGYQKVSCVLLVKRPELQSNVRILSPKAIVTVDYGDEVVNDDLMI
jgi:hypothetical protein